MIHDIYDIRIPLFGLLYSIPSLITMLTSLRSFILSIIMSVRRWYRTRDYDPDAYYHDDTNALYVQWKVRKVQQLA